MTSGETDGFHGRLETGYEGLTFQHTVPVREHQSSGYSTDKQATPQGLPRGVEDERPSREDTTRLVQRTDQNNEVLVWEGLQELEMVEDIPSKN